MATAAAAGVLTVANSAPAVADIKHQIVSAQAKLNALNNSSEVAAEKYNAARIRLATAQQRSKVEARSLARANATLTADQAAASAFARQVYMSGGLGNLTSAIADGSASDMVRKAGEMQAVSISQSHVLADLAAARRAQQGARATAQATLAEQQNATKQALSYKQTVQRNAAQAQQLLTTLRAKEAVLIRTAKAAAAKRAAQAQAAALARQQALTTVASQGLGSQPLTPPTSAPVHHYSGNAVQIAIQVAKAQLGKPYVWGAAGPNSFDCSGLTMYAYGKAGVSLSHYTGSQWNEGRHVSQSAMQPGDLVFFNTDASLGHVGIYLGGGQFIHAPHTGDVVKISALSGYYQQTFAGAVRVVG